MPRCDRTGPRGEGPRTGRGAGHCEGTDVSGTACRRSGEGRAGRGCGRPRRMRGRASWLYGPQAEQ